MSDLTPMDTAPDEVRAQLLTAGALLRQAREASGLHIAALAVSMKVPVKKLEALEADRFDQLPDAVFVRALASSMCRSLKVDPAPILEKLPQSHIPKLDTEARSINTPFHASGEARSLELPDFLRQPAVVAVVVLLVAAGAVTFWPESPDTPATVAEAPALAPVAMPPVNQPELVASNSNPPTQMQAPATEIQDAGATKPAATPEVIAAAPVNTQVPAAAIVAPAAGTPASSPAVVAHGKPMGAAPGTGVVAFRVKGTSWIEVTDSKGILQLRRTLQAGESAEASGALPLQVTIGKADVTTVEVRGKPFSLADVAKDNVARFEVK